MTHRDAAGTVVAMHQGDPPFDGGCACGKVRYRVSRAPIFVHGCHCRQCQRQTGTAFAINALVEATAVQLQAGTTEATDVPSPSGAGQRICRCAACKVALWSHYLAGGEAIAYVRVGTLDEPGRISPDIHIYTSTKHPVVVLPDGVPAVDEYYRAKEHWPAESLARARAARGG